jgi:hypothetical protein
MPRIKLKHMKMRAFWDITQCSLGVDRRFRGTYCLHHQGIEYDEYSALKRYGVTRKSNII